MFDMSFVVRESCRLCYSIKLRLVLELPPTPLANEFVSADNLKARQPSFPLFIVRCDCCGHFQLPVVVDPERLFRNYVYVSGTSKSFVDHFKALAAKISTSLPVDKGSLVVEIGSNDGTALLAFKQLGMVVLGVDPATKIAEIASSSGIPTLPVFFNKTVAQEIKEKHGNASIVLANNVFAHADDLGGIVDGIIHLLDPKLGVYILEVQYLPDMLEHAYFDMVYHEHLSYHTIEPLIQFLATKGLNVLDVESVPTHGGSIRVFSGMRERSPEEDAKLKKFIDKERSRLQQFDFDMMSAIILEAKKDLQELLAKAERKIWGFGAPAKLTTLFYSLDLDPDKFVAVIDDNPLKQGLFTPGSHIPIVSFEHFCRNASPSGDDVLVFAWNFAEQIKHRFINMPHRLYTPLPRLKRLN